MELLLHFFQIKLKEFCMKNGYRLLEKDMLAENHFPIQAIFNSISGSLFIETISSLVHGIGFGVEYGACIFSNDLDEYEIASREEVLDGVEFGLHNGEEVVVNYQTFYYYLRKACESYVEEFPDDKEKTKVILKSVVDRFNL